MCTGGESVTCIDEEVTEDLRSVTVYAYLPTESLQAISPRPIPRNHSRSLMNASPTGRHDIHCT